MLCCLKGWQQTLNCVGVVAEDHTSLLAGVMVLTWASISTAFNTSFIFPPHKCFLWQHYLQKKVSKEKESGKLCKQHSHSYMLSRPSPCSRVALLSLPPSLPSHSAFPGTTHRVGLVSLVTDLGLCRTGRSAPSSHAMEKPGPPLPWWGLGALLPCSCYGVSLCTGCSCDTSAESSPGIHKPC